MKKIYLLDTNIVSEFSKERPNEQVVGLYNLRRDQCAISSVTWQELVFGFSRMPEGRKKDYIRSCLDLYKRDLEIIPYDEFAASICGEVQSNAEQAGKKSHITTARLRQQPFQTEWFSSPTIRKISRT